MKNALYFILAVLFLQVAGITSTHAQACRPDTRVVEKDPIGPKRNCMGVPGLYFKRSLCNVPPFRTYDPLKNEIMVPRGKTAGCFTIVATTGAPVWKIYDPATGALMYASGTPMVTDEPGVEAAGSISILNNFPAPPPGRLNTIGVPEAYIRAPVAGS